MALWCGAWFHRSFGLAPRSAFAQLVGRARPSRRSLLPSRPCLQKRKLARMTSPAYLSAVPSPKQDYDYFLVLDFEATCSQQKGVPSPQLTGIVQDMVDGQPHLTEVLAQFDRWMGDQGLREARAIFVTFGDWDLQKMLPSQCAYLGLPVPSYFTPWINLKKAFVQCTGHWPKTLPDALQFCGLPHLGHHHSGIGEHSSFRRLPQHCAAPALAVRARPPVQALSRRSSRQSCRRKPRLGTISRRPRTSRTASAALSLRRSMRKASTRVAERLMPWWQWTSTRPPGSARARSMKSAAWSK
ncbi:snipper isoform X2 [Haemaphysalis longicornis]